MSKLSVLIRNLQKGVKNNAPYIKHIKYPPLLIAALKDLNKVIGNESVKDSVASQVSYLILVKPKVDKGEAPEVMLNTLLYGPPGVGKTLIGTKLAKIWYALGYLQQNANSKKSSPLKSMVAEVTGTASSGSFSTTDIILIMIWFVLILLIILSLAFDFYNKLGVIYERLGIITFLVIIAFFVISCICIIYWLSQPQNQGTQTKTDKLQTRDTRRDTSKSDLSKAEASKTELSELDELTMPADSDIIKVVSRSDFVGAYVGWSAPMTERLLRNNLGKVLFVDEAYSLLNSDRDPFGLEALTALTLFLSQHPGELIVIFAGYKDKLDEGVFTAQPGLLRRFMWHFECPGYTGVQLYQMLIALIERKSWKLDPTQLEAIEKLMVDNTDAFTNYGGDVDRLSFFSELAYSDEILAGGKNPKDTIQPHHIEQGIKMLRIHNIQKSSTKKPAMSEDIIAEMLDNLKNNTRTQPLAKDYDHTVPDPMLYKMQP